MRYFARSSVPRPAPRAVPPSGRPGARAPRPGQPSGGSDRRVGRASATAFVARDRPMPSAWRRPTACTVHRGRASRAAWTAHPVRPAVGVGLDDHARVATQAARPTARPSPPPRDGERDSVRDRRLPGPDLAPHGGLCGRAEVPARLVAVGRFRAQAVVHDPVVVVDERDRPGVHGVVAAGCAPRRRGRRARARCAAPASAAVDVGALRLARAGTASGRARRRSPCCGRRCP